MGGPFKSYNFHSILQYSFLYIPEFYKIYRGHTNYFV